MSTIPALRKGIPENLRNAPVLGGGAGSEQELREFQTFALAELQSQIMQWLQSMRHTPAIVIGMCGWWTINQ
jgi:hypothetical protein